MAHLRRMRGIVDLPYVDSSMAPTWDPENTQSQLVDLGDMGCFVRTIRIMVIGKSGDSRRRSTRKRGIPPDRPFVGSAMGRGGEPTPYPGPGFFRGCERLNGTVAGQGRGGDAPRTSRRRCGDAFGMRWGRPGDARRIVDGLAQRIPVNRIVDQFCPL